jgi:hypothetical protein
MLEMPLFWSVVGSRGWISPCHTLAYIPGVPSAALLPGSRLPQFLESEQHGLLVPQKGPAAHAVQPMYSSFAAIYLIISVT